MDQPPTGRPLHRLRLWDFQAVRDVLMILTLLGVIWLGKALSLVTVPLLMGLGLAYLIEPLVCWMTAHVRWMTRRRAVLAIIGSAALTFVAVLAFTLPPIIAQGAELAGNADRYAMRAHDWINHQDRPAWLRERATTLDAALRKLGLTVPPPPDSAPPSTTSGAPAISAPAPTPTTVPATGVLDETRIRQLIREELAGSMAPAAPTSSLGERAVELVKTVGGGLAAIAGSLFTVILTVAIAAVTTVSFAFAWPDILAMGRELIPAAHRERVLELVGRMDRTVSAFVRGRLTVAAIVGCLYAIGWTVVGVPYGLLLGLGVGVLSLVPYLAAVGLPVAWLLLALHLIAHPDPSSWYLEAGTDGAVAIVWWKVLVFPWLVNFVTQQTEDYVLNPLIQGKATELHPAAIMIAVIAGGSLAGLYGMLLAVPVAACAKILLSAEILPRFRSWVGKTGATMQLTAPSKT